MQLFSQRNHPVDIHIFHNAHATIAWPQQTLLQETLELERTTYNCHSKKDAATRTTITTLNMYTYHQILQILMPSFRILVFRDISLGKPQILHSYFSMLTRLDDREGLYLYSYNGMVSWYRLCECFYLHSRTFQTILIEQFTSYKVRLLKQIPKFFAFQHATVLLPQWQDNQRLKSTAFDSLNFLFLFSFLNVHSECNRFVINIELSQKMPPPQKQNHNQVGITLKGLNHCVLLLTFHVGNEIITV